MRWPSSPTVYEISAWIWLRELSDEAGRPVTLGGVPDAELVRIAELGFDAVWLMGVWQRSPGGRRIAREEPDLEARYHQALPEFTLEDVVGSPYAVHAYRVDPALGGDEELASLWQRLRRLGLRLILDFVCNHLAWDHPWVAAHPERFVQGDDERLAAEPQSYFAAEDGRVFAHGRDPHLDAWTDTVQLDYRRPETRRAMADTLFAVAERCDGVRCDMAMLLIHDVFIGTWGGRSDPAGSEFWPGSIAAIKERRPDFVTIAEAYWGLGHCLLGMGFDYAYDKDLYDLLVAGRPDEVRAHLAAGGDDPRRLVRFTENHDEPRAVAAFGGVERSLAAATLALTLPGLRLYHDGQLEGRRRFLPVQLGRRHPEGIDADVERFYRRLLLETRDRGLPRRRVATDRGAGGGRGGAGGGRGARRPAGRGLRVGARRRAPDRRRQPVGAGQALPATGSAVRSGRGSPAVSGSARRGGAAVVADEASAGELRLELPPSGHLLLDCELDPEPPPEAREEPPAEARVEPRGAPMAEVRILRVVVASPGDVLAERERLLRVLDEVNRGVAADRALVLTLSRWETDSYPGFHVEGPQGLIDRVLKIEDCDVLIGIFWKRFGTPVADAGSGTEHEFQIACRQWRATERPQIMVYFNEAPYTLRTAHEAEQCGRVLKFREEFPPEGLWWPYQGPDEFEALVRRHLSNFIRDRFDLPRPPAAPPPPAKLPKGRLEPEPNAYVARPALEEQILAHLTGRQAPPTASRVSSPSTARAGWGNPGSRSPADAGR